MGTAQKDIFDLASPRLQRLREKVAMFSFQVCWVPGKTHLIADALSRAPLFAPEDLPGLEIDYRQLLEDVKNGTSVSLYSRALKGNFESLSIMDNLVLLDSRRIVLPLFIAF